MRLWRSKRHDEARPDSLTVAPGAEESPDDANAKRQTEPKQQLERALYELADVIGGKDKADRFWSTKVRGCADQVRAGQVEGLRNFLGLFGGMGSINDQDFSGALSGELGGTHALASSLLGEIEYDSPHARLRARRLAWASSFLSARPTRTAQRR